MWPTLIRLPKRSFFHVKSFGVSAISSVTDMMCSSVGTLQAPFYLQTLAVLSGDASSFNPFLLTPSCAASSERDCYLWHDFSAENLKYKGIVNLNFCPSSSSSSHLSLNLSLFHFLQWWHSLCTWEWSCGLVWSSILCSCAALLGFVNYMENFITINQPSLRNNFNITFKIYMMTWYS